MSWSTIIYELCAYILVWTFNMRLYGALHIVCQHIYMHSIAFYAPDGFVCEDPTSLSSVCSPVVDQGARGILPTVCAYSFSVCRFRLVRYVLPVYVGLGPKLHTCILLQFMCITYLWMQLVISDLFLSID